MPNEFDAAGQGGRVHPALTRTHAAQDKRQYVRAQVLRNWPWSVAAAAAVHLVQARAGHRPESTGVDLAVFLFAVPVGCLSGAVGAERLTRRWRPGR